MQDKPVALVTGANQGIGLQIAKDLVAHGFTVLVGSRNFERGEAAAKEIGPGAIALQLDVTDQASIAAAAERIRNEFGRLDVLVNNAAISNTRQAARHVRRGVREVDPREQRRPSMKCARSGRPTCSASSPFTRRCCRSCAKSPGRPHRQRVERRRLADDELGPGLPLPRDLRPRLPGVQDGSQRHDARHGDRAGVDRDQGQRGLPGLHQDEPQRLCGHGIRRGRRPRGGARCAARPGRPAGSTPARWPGSSADLPPRGKRLGRARRPSRQGYSTKSEACSVIAPSRWMTMSAMPSPFTSAETVVVLPSIW